MIRKNVLNEAKAFLCWDRLKECSVQLIEMQETVSYFHPPGNSSTILVYYERGKDDFSIPLFHLFHEAGHCLQFQRCEKLKKTSGFWDIINQPTGPERCAFETESWQMGRELFHSFIMKSGLPSSVLEAYDDYAERAIQGYR